MPDSGAVEFKNLANTLSGDFDDVVSSCVFFLTAPSGWVYWKKQGPGDPGP